MANPTMTLIASNLVGAGGVSSITFSSIPATYTDLKLVASTRASGAVNYLIGAVRFNSDASSIYSDRLLFANGSPMLTFSSTDSANNFAFAITSPGANATANTFGNSELYIPNYASSNNKSFSQDGVSENNTTDSDLSMIADLWSSTAAINSITIFPGSGYNFVQYSTFYLYGIKNS